MEGYFVKDCPDVIRYLLDQFTKKTVIFTLSATFMIQYFFDIVKEVSDRSDIIFCNREEAEVFVKLTDKVRVYNKKITYLQFSNKLKKLN